MIPNTPDQVWLGREDYSWYKDFAVNGWLMGAALISGAADIMFPQIVRQWPVGLRSFAAIVPFVFLLLWIRSLLTWVKGMDELHRRITVSACLFCTSATLLFTLLWHRLDVAGLWNATFPVRVAHRGSWDIATPAHVFLLFLLFYAIGQNIYGKRYR